MKTIQLVFALHDHQPVGNFDHVFADAYDKAYLPFLELLESYSRLRVCLHHTGPLLRWIEANRPEYLRRLAKLVERDQVELFGGAFYEPILSIIPEADRIGQIKMMSDWLEQRFGRRPRGMWLAERVWEPTLPRTMRAAGMEYTVLDDSHFQSVGIRPEEALGYYLTEDQGEPVAVFPISEQLRYKIPYQEPHETINYLRTLAADEIARTIVMADDGEKFGVWPESHRHCYEDGWMYRFAELVTNNDDWIQMRTFSEVLDSTTPMGRVYLPTASYLEMMEWAMPPQSLAQYKRVVKKMQDTGEYDRNRTYMRGGFWRSFFSRYDEANLLHKKMLHVSRKVRSVPENLQQTPEYLAARDHLWQAQCNCGYWHGVFGGIYLTNLRNALYRHLISADTTVDKLTKPGKDWVSFQASDFDVDGATELLVETPAQVILVQPHLGGMIVMHDIREAKVNLLDTFMRRREYYHDLLEERGAHGEMRVKEEDLAKYLALDWYRRGSLIDHFLPEAATPEDFRSAMYPELGDFINQPYELEWRRESAAAHLVMRREGQVALPTATLPVTIEKEFHLAASTASNRIVYRITNHGTGNLDTRFGVEFNVALLAGNAPDRYHAIDRVDLKNDNHLASIGRIPNVTRFRVVDEWQKLKVEWTLSAPAEHWRLPIETVSNSEYGIERIYQSTVIMPVWEINIPPRQTFQLEITYNITNIS